MRKLLAVLLCFPLTTIANPLPRQHTSNGDTIFALDTPCKDEAILKAFKKDLAPKAKSGLYRGVNVGDIKGCYVEIDKVLHFLFSDGDVYAVPEQFMKREPVPPRGTSI